MCRNIFCVQSIGPIMGQRHNLLHGEIGSYVIDYAGINLGNPEDVPSRLELLKELKQNILLVLGPLNITQAVVAVSNKIQELSAV